MCMGCMANADFVLTSGILGAASLRVGARKLLPRTPRWTRNVTAEEAQAFVASLAPSKAVPDDHTVGAQTSTVETAALASSTQTAATIDERGDPGHPDGTRVVAVPERVVVPLGDRVLAGR